LSQVTTARFRAGLGLQVVAPALVATAIPASTNQTWTLYVVKPDSTQSTVLTSVYSTGGTLRTFEDIAAGLDTNASFAGFTVTASGEYLEITNNSGARFSVYVRVEDSTSHATQALLVIGDFGTSTVREVGVHDSVFLPQDLDTAKWNVNSSAEIGNTATTIPHLTVLGTGDGNPDFYSFEITAEMLSNALKAYKETSLNHTADGFSGVRVMFDIDHGYDLGDSKFWVSALKLYELRAPLDPSQPTLPNKLAESPFFNFNRDVGSTYFFDAALDTFIQSAGTYYIEVTAAYPFGLDGLPTGVDYQLHVSIDQHPRDAFVFAPAAVNEQEATNNSSPGQVLDGGTKPGENFFTFYDPNVGNVVLNNGSPIDSTTPYVRVRGSGDFTYDIYTFNVASSPKTLSVIGPQDFSGLGSTANTTNSLKDTASYVTSVSYVLSGTPASGDVWRLGLGYRDFVVNVTGNSTTLSDIATDLAGKLNSAGFTATANDGTPGKLTVTAADPFVLAGRAASFQVYGDKANVGNVLTVTARLGDNTLATVSNIKVDLAGTGLSSSDDWTLTSTEPRPPW
jgi:hypothetical protein